MKITLKSVMAGAVALVMTGGLVVAGAGAAQAATFDPDPTSVGSVSFFNAAGVQIGGGNIADLPLATYYKASGPAVGTAGSGYVTYATPQDGIPTASWTSNEQWTSGQNYTSLQASYPAGLNNAATNVVIKGSATDGALADHVTNFPNVSVLNPGVYQIRLYTSASSTTYYATSITVSGSTWTQTFPALPAAIATTTTLAAVASPVTVNAASTTLSASVSAASGTITDGSVKFLDGATVLGTVAYAGSNPVTLTVPASGAGSFGVGTHSLTAAYVPTGITFAGSTSTPARTLVVNPVQLPTSVAVAANVGSGQAFSPVVVTGTVSPIAAAGTVVFSEGAVTLGSATTNASGIASLTVSTLSAGSHTIHGAFTPTDAVTYAGSAGDSAPFTLTTPAVAPDLQDIKVTVENGSLVLSSPYGPTNKFDLGSMVLDATGTYLYTERPFGDATHPELGLTVTDTRAGNTGWTVSAVASNFSDGSGHSIDAKGLGLTGVTPQYIVPNAINAATNPVTPFNVIPNDLTVANAAAAGLSATSPIASVVHGDGTVRITGILKLYAPSSTVAGTYSSVLTFTAV